MSTVTVRCPDCARPYAVDRRLLGREGRCKRCGRTFPLSEGGSPGPPPSETGPGPDADGLGPVSLAPAPAASTASGARPLAPSDDLPEQFGRYRIVRRLGRGGMGSVYLAHDSQLDRSVALKVPHFGPDADPDVLRRFEREARAAATFDHPNLCPVYDVGEVDGVCYLTMPYIEGKPLSEVIDPDRPFPENQAASVVRKLALAMAEAHGKGVVHRDLKPANILINRRRELVILDFGLARRDGEGVDARLTQSGALLGTPHYMAPEQVNGDASAIGPACDVYALGVILYELLTGRRPYEGPMSLVLGLIAVSDPSPPSAHRPDLDPSLEAICLRAMARDLERRYGSMVELADALAAYLVDQAAPAQRDAPGGPAGPPAADAQDPAAAFFAKVAAEQGWTAHSIRPNSSRPAVSDRPRNPPSWLRLGLAGAAVLLLGLLLHGILTRDATDDPPDPADRPANDAPGSLAGEGRSNEPIGQARPESLTSPGGWVPLLNGTDLSGWTIDGGDPASWRVDAGELVVVANPRDRGWLLTDRSYTDFALRFQFRVDPGASSGVAFWAEPGEKPLEIQILDEMDPSFDTQLPPNMRTGSLWGVALDRPARLYTPGSWNEMEIVVIGTTLHVSVNGRSTLDADLDSLGLDAPALARRSGRIGFQNWDHAVRAVRFRKIELKDLSEAQPLLKLPKPIDLIPLIDPTRDSIQREWIRVAGHLISPEYETPRLQIVYDPPDEYRLEMVVERKTGDCQLAIGLVVGGHQVVAHLDGWSGRRSGLDLRDGPFGANETTKISDPLLPKNQQVRIICSVRQRGLQTEKIDYLATITCNDQTIIDWMGDPARLAVDPRLDVPNKGSMFLGSWLSRFHISSLVLIPLSSDGNAAAPSKDGPSARSYPGLQTNPAIVHEVQQSSEERGLFTNATELKVDEKPPLDPWVDLLALIDPGKHVQRGEWSRQGDVLSAARSDGTIAHVMIPIAVGGSYDLRIRFTRVGPGHPNDPYITINLPVGTKGDACAVVLGEGRFNGLSLVDGKKTSEGNPTNVAGRVIPGRVHTADVEVRDLGGTASVRIWFDGTPHLSWRGRASSLTLPQDVMLPEKKSLGLGACNGAVSFSQASIRLVSDKRAVEGRATPIH